MTSASASAGLLPVQRTAVITGAGGLNGIGRVTAHKLAEDGWSVALIDVNKDGLSTVETELREAGPSGVLAVPTDITSESAVADAYQQIDAALPPVVGLVNLAGIACAVTLHECSLAEFEKVSGGQRHRIVPDAEGRRRADDPARCRTDREHLLDH